MSTGCTGLRYPRRRGSPWGTSTALVSVDSETGRVEGVVTKPPPGLDIGRPVLTATGRWPSVLPHPAHNLPTRAFSCGMTGSSGRHRVRQHYRTLSGSKRRDHRRVVGETAQLVAAAAVLRPFPGDQCHEEGERDLAGFLVWPISPALRERGYVHLVGVRRDNVRRGSPASSTTGSSRVSALKVAGRCAP